METLFIIIRHISDAFSGNYKSSLRSSDIYDATILDLNIPTTSDDKRNLEKDRRAIVNDFNNAFEDYKLDHAI